MTSVPPVLEKFSFSAITFLRYAIKTADSFTLAVFAFNLLLTVARLYTVFFCRLLAALFLSLNR